MLEIELDGFPIARPGCGFDFQRADSDLKNLSRRGPLSYAGPPLFTCTENTAGFARDIWRRFFVVCAGIIGTSSRQWVAMSELWPNRVAGRPVVGIWPDDPCADFDRGCFSQNPIRKNAHRRPTPPNPAEDSSFDCRREPDAGIRIASLTTRTRFLLNGPTTRRKCSGTLFTTKEHPGDRVWEMSICPERIIESTIMVDCGPHPTVDSATQTPINVFTPRGAIFRNPFALSPYSSFQGRDARAQWAKNLQDAG